MPCSPLPLPPAWGRGNTLSLPPLSLPPPPPYKLSQQSPPCCTVLLVTAQHTLDRVGVSTRSRCVVPLQPLTQALHTVGLMQVTEAEQACVRVELYAVAIETCQEPI